MNDQIKDLQQKLLNASKKVLLAPKIVLSIPKNVLEMGIDVLEVSMDMLEHPGKVTEIPKHLFNLPSRVLEKLIKAYLIVNADLHQPSFANQKKILFDLIRKAKKTSFGEEYHFETIKTIKDFQKQIPIFHYKDFEPWILRMVKGELDVSYPGKIDRFATSSGTTGGTAKYIPITKENLKTSHFRGGIESLSLYIKNNPKSKFFQGKGLVIGGGFIKNPFTGEDNVGFISAILQKESPWIGQTFKTPGPDISYMEDREEKVKKTIALAETQNVTSISGQPSWMSNFLYRVLEATGKKNILEVWPNLEFFFWGGMAIHLYKKQLEALIPSKTMKYYQIYNASEGYFASQDTNDTDDMLLFTDHGVFYEFIPLQEYGKENPTVLTLDQVEVDKEYVILITNTSGLRRYILGDTIKFTTLNPWRIKITGRTKYYIDVVGECVTSDYSDRALVAACNKTQVHATDYMVAPIMYEGGEVRGAYEWIIECDQVPENQQEFATILDKELCDVNSYYYDERYDTKVLGEPTVHLVPKGTFYLWLKSKNKLGGQHKIPKLANDRKNIDEVLKIIG
ncbi:hypothetical protein P148_SR1C00001G0363 [candidate division SR1 bacterium RAAC1_SR1_1]|nr:hypothetical protein P148_SR1C00001G0363 [candidate division SR1 bacterium RAAC1_SR1_1]